MTEQKKIPRCVWYGLDGASYDNIAQELPSEDPLLRRWASIYAIYKYKFSNDPHQYYEFIHKSKNSKYALIIFTIPSETIDTNDGIDDRDINISDLHTMNSEEEIYTILGKLGIDSESFTPPWRCEYPL